MLVHLQFSCLNQRDHDDVPRSCDAFVSYTQLLPFHTRPNLRLLGKFNDIKDLSLQKEFYSHFVNQFSSAFNK